VRAPPESISRERGSTISLAAAPFASAALMATTSSSVFEGLFVRALSVEPAVKDKLRAIGVNLDQLEVSYPTAKLSESMDLVAREMFATMPHHQALQEMGRRFVHGFKETIVGRLAYIGMPAMTCSQLIDKTPRLLAMVGSSTKSKVEVLSERSRRMTFTQEAPIPDFFAGLYEGALGLTRGAPRVNVMVENRHANGFDLVISW
jgi:uncharacterized protein (TIGR02265 family)